MNRKYLSCVYLSLVAIMPLVFGIYQTIHFVYWLFGIDAYFVIFSSIFDSGWYSLLLCFLISLYERFCIYHRIVIVACFYTSFSCYILDWFPSIEFYNITNIIAIFFLVFGIIGCIIHFGYQIKDFIRYVRTKK